jgi:CheY-like chemotaxis protein
MPDANVLVGDDVQSNLMVAMGLLKPYGLCVDTALSGQEAIGKIKSGEYDLVFMDHMMQEIDGVETVKQIREWEQVQVNDRKPVPIIAMTANVLRGMREFFLEHGFQDFLPKPVSPQALDDVLKKWLGNEKLEIRNEELTEDTLSDNFALVVQKHHLDILNHYRTAFEMESPDRNGKIDSDYFKRFLVLAESLITGNLSTTLNEQAVLLIEAAEKEDTQKIRELLPDFYEGLKQRIAASEMLSEGEKFKNILLHLKHEIASGELKETGKIMAEIRSLQLNHSDRELFFLINDLLLEGESNKAVEEIDNLLRSNKK